MFSTENWGSVNDWKDSVFETHAGSVPYEVNGAMIYLEKFASEWTSISIYEFYDGFQVTVSDGQVSKKVIVSVKEDENEDGYTENDSDEVLDELMRVVYLMQNLTEFKFFSRFEIEIENDYFKIPLPSVQNIIIHNVQMMDIDFIGNAKTVTIKNVYSDKESCDKLKLIIDKVDKVYIDMLVNEDDDNITILEELEELGVTVIESDGF